MMFFQQAALLFLLLEFFVLALVAGSIGFFKTFFLWLLSAAIGIVIIQRQGLAMLLRTGRAFERGAVPVDDIFDGMCLVVAGLLFLTPGFISDILGFFLLVPAIRHYFRTNGETGFGGRTDPWWKADTGVIDGTYVRVEETVEAIEQSTPSKNLPDNLI